MRIYQILHFPLKGAGAGIYVDQLTRALIKRGHQVRVLCADHYLPQKQYPVDVVLFNNGKNNRRFDLDFDFPVFISHPLSKGGSFGELSKIQREAYIRVFQKKVEEGIAVFSPDLIHVHHGWVIASIVAQLDIPYVISLHGTEYYAFREFDDYRELVLKGLHGAQIIITPTEQERDKAIQAYDLDPERVVVVKEGVDTELFKPLDVSKKDILRSYSIAETDRPIVFFGGRLTVQKGVDILLKAAWIYSQTDESPLTLIAGDGDLRSQLQSLAKQLKLKSVHFLGYQSEQMMAKLYNIADVVVIPSLFEPFGRIAIEALACGTPVIASKVGGLVSIVNEQVGYLIEVGDYTALAEKVITCLRDRFKAKIRYKAASYARENFDWEQIVGDIESTYKRANKRIQPTRSASLRSATRAADARAVSPQ